MNQSMRWLVALIVIVLIIALGWYLFAAPQGTGPTATSTATSTQTGGVTGQSQSDGTIEFDIPSDFGMATNPQQILVSSYIPACDEGFLYCLYYNGDAYEGTNFESAGLAITKRADLATESACLETPPEGFASTVHPSATSSATLYSTSVFSNVGDAGAGHTASGTDHRLFVKSNSSCYSLMTRIGKTQFGNYPEGTIEEFTAADEAELTSKLNAILGSVTIGETSVSFAGAQ